MLETKILMFIALHPLCLVAPKADPKADPKVNAKMDLVTNSMTPPCAIKLDGTSQRYALSPPSRAPPTVPYWGAFGSPEDHTIQRLNSLVEEIIP